MSYDVYEDIAKRTGGDVYIGVVGPVRCGKSTFISKFVNTLVLPNIENKYDKERAIDEMPQSASGKTIMTTQPKFIPNEAIGIRVGENVSLNVRLVDCVGYMVAGAMGHEEGSKPRLVKTPWSEEAMPFEEAAEIGTKKVISDHSTFAIAMTTDGSFTDIPRNNYIESEERIINDLKESGKPYVLVINTTTPTAEATLQLRDSLASKYDCAVLCLDVANLNNTDVDNLFGKVLEEFPFVSLKVKMPNWMRALDYDDEIIQELVRECKGCVDNVNRIGQINTSKVMFEDSNNFMAITVSEIKMGEGVAVVEVKPKPELFYNVLSKQSGCDIQNDYQLISYLKELSFAKREYDKLKVALAQVEETGYGVVTPSIDQMKLEEPEIVKQGSKYGVRLKASAPSLHIMRVDIETEISPVVGSEQQSEDLVKYLLKEFENDPKGIWNTDMFGKSLNVLVNEGLTSKLVQMPAEAQKKMRKTLSRIVNEGKGGIICILL